MLKSTSVRLNPLRVSVAQRRSVLVRAAEEPKSDKSDAEARLELLESRIKAGRSADARPTPVQQQQMQQQSQMSTSNRTVWKEGQLFPEGFDDMPMEKKLNELYMGERGFLFWINKFAYASVFILIGGWIVFRIVGPALGLYQLAGDGPRL